ncbi:hypothetical protein F4W70_03550 [Pseudomonas cannabina]|nr:hypothetical protein F4W70_03550 [Pseudomonas cannabina]
MGCEAAPRQTTSVVSDTPRRLILLPVPGSSRTSEASPGPVSFVSTHTTFPLVPAHREVGQALHRAGKFVGDGDQFTAIVALHNKV